MYRTHTCGELRLADAGKQVTLAGWVQRSRDLGGMTFIDLRDRYGITQLVFNMETNPALCEQARTLGREYVIQASGAVTERSNKNPRLPTGDIEIITDRIVVLNPSLLPPFTIEDETDGGDELRMKYRFLDLRRTPVRKNLELRHRMTRVVRIYLDSLGFIEVETPVLVRSTPEGARDFLVPSRMNPGEFYALPQSPQTLKQLLMVAGYDRYYQIVKCFRDEDLRADRQPEFTQIDCEMSFVTRDDVLETFEGLAKYLFDALLGIRMNESFPRLSYEEAMEKYGTDKPDLRFDMRINELTEQLKGKGFGVFDKADYVGAVCAKDYADCPRKEMDELTEFVKKPQIGGNGIVFVKYNRDNTLKSSIDKYYSGEALRSVAGLLGAEPGDLILIMAGEKMNTLNALGLLRLEIARRLGLRTPGLFSPLWVVDFPLLEWDEDAGRFFAKHHPFTSPMVEDIPLFDTDPAAMRANAYDLVINGIEIGGGSIRIHDEMLQKKMFRALGFTDEEARNQFGFLMHAFRYGAPPHGGIAFGLDRWVALIGGSETIRDYIAFPKNNQGRDMMLDTPSTVDDKQLRELHLRTEL